MGLALPKNDANNMRETIVIGLGETGFSVARHLSKQNIAFTMMDTRLDPPELSMFKNTYPDTDVYLEKEAVEKLNNLSGAAQLIVSPGVDINQDIFQKTVTENDSECIGDIEIFARCTNKPIVAITGSNGKSTVTSLLAEMARTAKVKAYAGGNLGPPALDLLDCDDAELFVLELSSFQLESTKSLQPEVSAVLNVSADHLDRHGDVDNYANIKEQIYSKAKFSVVNREDNYVSKMHYSGEVIRFGLTQPAIGEFGVIEDSTEAFLAFGEQRLLPVSELALQGESGILNSLAALAMGYVIKLPMQVMLAELKNFKGLPHRLALVSRQKGIAWFNDSKGTNIGATISSLRSLNNEKSNESKNSQKIILIAGGIFKGGDLALLKDEVSKHAKHVILLGQDAPLMQQGLEGAAPISIVRSMSHAVEEAQHIAANGDQVLLSPACASFDMYKNYIERGCDFENCVRGLAS